MSEIKAVKGEIINLSEDNVAADKITIEKVHVAILPVNTQAAAEPNLIETTAKEESACDVKTSVTEITCQDKISEPSHNDACSTEQRIPQPLTNEQVTAHTASLWEYHPISESATEAFPEYMCDTLKFPRSSIIAARVRGKKHKHEGTNCDDWYEVANYQNITFIAVSDGAGSKKFSRIGAKCSCEAAIGFLLDSFENIFAKKPEMLGDLKLPLDDKKCENALNVAVGIVQQSAVKARDAVLSAFYSRKSRRNSGEYEKLLGRKLQLKDLSATLLIAVIIPVSDSSKENLIISCQVGDGMIAALNSHAAFKDSVKLLCKPDSGDFSGETDFLTSPQMGTSDELEGRIRVSRNIFDTVFVMTDGVSDDYYPSETGMNRLYLDLLANGILEQPDDEKFDGLMEWAPNARLSIKDEVKNKFPAPISHPWVNDTSKSVPVQYTNKIMEHTGKTLEMLWERSICVALAANRLSEDEDAAARLKIWLDNYTERGSFDDRTLVIAQM